MGAWMSRSKRVGSGKGKPSSLNVGAGCSDGSSSLSALRSIHTEGSAFGAYYRRLVERGREDWLGVDGGDAQNAGGRGPLAQTPAGEL